MDESTPRVEVTDDDGAADAAAAELCAVLEIGRALRPLSEDAQRRVIARLLARPDVTETDA
jgi:hypothetical protein